MPFSKTETSSKEEWQKIYDELFRPIIENAPQGYECKRSELENGSFTKDIVKNLKDSYLVLVDLTDFNPNVMWELGVRHSLSKKTILVAREEFITKIPTDIKEYGVIPYEDSITSYKKFETEINKILVKIEKNPEKSDSPVFNYLKEEDLILRTYERYQTIKKILALLAEFAEHLEFVEGMKNGSHKIEEKSLTYARLRTIAIDLLLSSNYVSTTADYISKLKNYRDAIFLANKKLDVCSNTIISHESIKKEVIDDLKKY